MTEPKLLTEAEWHNLLARPTSSQIIDDLRERGLIAPEPEPVDPLLDEAREIVAKLSEDDGNPAFACAVRSCKRDDDLEVRIALTALRRGMELAERPTLTREMVREAGEIASRLTPMRETFVDCVYALLVERLK